MCVLDIVVIKYFVDGKLINENLYFILFFYNNFKEFIKFRSMGLIDK